MGTAPRRVAPPSMGKVSVYIGPDASEMLAARCADGEEGLRTRSAAVNTYLDRYAETCRRCIPLLPLADWLCIFDALNGVWLQTTASGLAVVWAEVEDHIRLNRADKIWVCDPDLGARLRGLGYGELVAVADAAERFWALNVQPLTEAEALADRLDGGGIEPDPHAPWRAPVRALVGALADDPEHRP